MTYQAVIFDLDGTLLDTLDDIADTANKILAGYGLPEHEPDAYRYFIGKGVDVLFRRALPETKSGDSFVAKCVLAFRERYQHNWNNTTRPYRGIPELLSALTDRGLKMAVLSNKPDVFTKKCVYELLPNWDFTRVVGEVEGVARKPDPAAALVIAGDLGVKPARVVYLGDSGIDMETAARSGFFPVGALWGFRSREELENKGARLVVEKPEDLLSYLDGTE